MRIKILCMILLSMLLAACGNGLKIVSISPGKDILLNQTFPFKVNEDICPSNKLNIWTDENFVKFTPEIKGKYKWISPNTFIFSPIQQLEPIQKYEATLTEAALFGAKEISISSDKIEFSTPDFKATKAEFFWSNIPFEYYKANIQSIIEFNYPVNIDHIKQYLVVKLNGNSINNYKISNTQETDKINIIIEKVQQTEKAQNIEITLKSGAESIYGKKGTEKEEVFKYLLPAKQDLEISGSASGFDGANGWVEIAFTQGLDEKDLPQNIIFNPSKSVQYAFMDNKVRITGNFGNSSTVNVILKKGLKGISGGVLKEDFEQDFSFVNLSPTINFTDETGKYLRYNGEKTLEVNAVNIDEVEIEVYQIFKNNLLYFLNRYSYMDDYSNFEAIEPESLGKVLYKEKVALNNNQNWLEKFQININKTIPNKDKGLYNINVYSTEDRWTNTSKTIAMTDLGLITKMSGGMLMVFCNSIETTEPIANVEITLISSSNQTIISGKTDKDGVFKFDSLNKVMGSFSPRLIVAETENDFNYLDLNSMEIETSRYDITGDFSGNDIYSAFIYGERDLYRPGETGHFSAIIRDNKMQVVKDFPVIFKVISPNGAMYREFSSSVNEQGSFEIALDFPDYIQTGIYRLELYTQSNEFINRHIINVEDFVPDKIRVALNTNKDDYKPGEIVNVNIESEFLFGGKASGLKYQTDFHLVEKQFYSNKYKDYSFTGSKNKSPSIENFVAAGVLDNEGKGKSEYMIPSTATTTGYFNGYAVVNVFDLNGRSVVKSQKFKVYPFDYFVGINLKGSYFGTGENIIAKTILLDKNSNPISNHNLTLKLIRYEWKSILKKDYGNNFYYDSERKQNVVWEKDISSSNNPKETKFAVEKSGAYELRISEKGSENYSSYEFYAYGWSSSTISSFEVDKDGRIDIVLDKEKYNVGEKAKALFTTPFNGKMLVTLERNGIENYYYLDVQNRSAELTFDLKEEFLPNVYISATLFKKHTTDNSTPFFVAHGYKSLNIENLDNKITTEIISPASIKPNNKIKVSVKTNSRNSFVTLSAVDEGILQLYNSKSPDPYNYYYSPKSLKTKSYDVYKFLLPEIAKSSLLTGGGDKLTSENFDAMIKARSNPIKTKRFKPFSYWSGITTTNSSGNAEFEINIPNINTEVRFMAVSYKDSKFGFAEKSMKVYNDLIIEPEVPRFLAPEDEFIMPVSIINTTKSSQSTKVQVNAENFVYLTSEQSQNVSVPANSHVTIEFKIKAKNEIGVGKIKIFTVGKIKSEELIEIGVRPVTPYTVTTKSGTIKAGETLNLSIPNDYYPKLTKSNLVISKLYASSYSGMLKKLVEYPHGCLEQTVSKAFPLLYLGDLANLVSKNTFAQSNPIYYINEAINKVSSMQRWDGGIAYWISDEQSQYWTSVYAAHFLISAKKANYQVNSEVLNKLMRYLQKRSKQNVLVDYNYYTNNSITSKKIANKNNIYALYVLAMAGKPDISTMNYYKANKNILTGDTRYLLAGAYAYSGRMNIFNELTNEALNFEQNTRSLGNDFDSYIRSNAIMLYVLADLNPNDAKIPKLVKFLNTNAIELKKAESTQDLAFTLLALGKVAKGQENSNVDINIFVDGKVIKSSKNSDLSLDEGEFKSNSISVKATGKGLMYYYFTIEGITKTKIENYDRNIKVRREYLDYKTKGGVNLENTTQGQLLYCKITITSAAQTVNNIAITNLIPACLEIENPRLPEVNRATFQSDKLMNVRNIDIRDDRLNLFTDIQDWQTREYYFMVRVSYRGKFSNPAISAEAMYAPSEYASLNGSGKFEIK